VGQHRVFRHLSVLILAATALVAGPIATSHQAASAGARSPRVAAYVWAYHNAGKPYCWGGTGPGCFDCSGLVMAAYQQQGLYFGRSTYDMLASGRLVAESQSRARRGDLAFYGTGHVEFFVRPGRTFGAQDEGTLIGWHQWNQWWHPTMFFHVRGAH
jgi:cell wall-associated NlpC family hydrolase